MKGLGNTSLAKLFLLIKTYVRDSIDAIKPSDIGAAAESHSHSPASYSNPGFMSAMDKKAIELVNPIRADSTNGAAYIADVSMLSISSLAVGTSFIMIPEKTSTSIYCELNFCGSGPKPIRVRTANYNGTVDLPTHMAWLTQYKPVRMTYDGTYWVADVVNAAAKQTVVPITLTSSGWDSAALTQTVTVSGVLADEAKQMIQPVPAIASQAAYIEAGILCTSQAADSLTFTAKTAPTEDLTVYVMIQEVVQG